MSDALRPPTNFRFKIFIGLWIVLLLNYIDRATLSVAMPYISKEFELDSATKGWILGAFFWSYLICQVPGGWLLDRFGPRRVVAGAAVIWGAFQAFGGFVQGGTALGAARFALGAAEAPCAPAGAKLNSNWLPARERARGATFVDMAGSFGSAVGGLLVTGIIGLFGSWRWAFIVTGALTIFAAIAYYMYVRDTPEEHPKVSAGEVDFIRSASANVSDVTFDGPLPGAADYARSFSFWGLMLGRLGWATVWWGIISWSPSYLADRMGFELAGLGWGMFFIYMMGVAGQLVAGALADRGRERSTDGNRVMKALLVGSGLGMVVSLFSLLLVDDGRVAVVLLALAVFFTNFGGLYWAIPAWLAPKAQVGTVSGVMNIASSGGGGLAPIVMGYAIAAAGGGYAGAFVFLGCAAALYMLGSLAIDFRRPLAAAPGGADRVATN